MKSELQFRVEWSETDPAAITFYPNYFKWFDWGTWNLLAVAGLTHEVLKNEYQLIGCPVVEATSRFRSPARFWDRVRLTSLVQSWNRKTFCVAHFVRVGERLCAEGLETRIWARESTERPGELEAIVVPESIKAKLPVIGTEMPVTASPSL